MKFLNITILFCFLSTLCFGQAIRTSTADRFVVRDYIRLNSENRTRWVNFFKRPTTPGGTLYEGDLWRNTSNGIFSVYDGSAWVQVSASVSDGDYGDITISSSGSIYTIDDGVVTISKLANGTANRLTGYNDSGTPSEINVTGNATLSGTTLNVTGDGTGTDDQTAAEVSAIAHGSISDLNVQDQLEALESNKVANSAIADMVEFADTTSWIATKSDLDGLGSGSSVWAESSGNTTNSTPGTVTIDSTVVSDRFEGTFTSTSGDVTRVLTPESANYSLFNTTQGVFQIVLPQFSTTGVISFDVKVLDGLDGEATTYTLSGYVNVFGWVSIGFCDASASARNLDEVEDVQFGNTNSRPFVIIGTDTTKSRGYPTVLVENITVGKNASTNDIPFQNWEVNLLTGSLPTTIGTLTPEAPAASANFSPTPLKAGGFISDDEILIIERPRDAVYRQWSGSITGALRIQLPTTASIGAKPVKYEIEVLNNLTKECETYEYVHYNVFASTSNRYTFSGDNEAKQLRAVVAGSRPTIYIGETTSTWSYLTVYVKRVTIQTAATIESSADWDNGWNVDIVTSFAGTPAVIPSRSELHFSQALAHSPSAGTLTRVWGDTGDGVGKYQLLSSFPFFSDDGNSYSATATLGTNDNHPLVFETVNTERLRLNTNGRADFTSSTGASTSADVMTIDGDLPTTSGVYKRIALQGGNSNIAAFGAEYEGTAGDYSTGLWSTDGGTMNSEAGLKVLSDNRIETKLASGKVLSENGILTAVKDTQYVQVIAVPRGTSVSQTSSADLDNEVFSVGKAFPNYSITNVDYSLLASSATSGSLTVGFRRVASNNVQSTSNLSAVTFTGTEVRKSSTSTISLAENEYYFVEVSAVAGTLNVDPAGLSVVLTLVED